MKLRNEAIQWQAARSEVPMCWMACSTFTAYLLLVYLKLLSVLLIIWFDNKLWILWTWKEIVLPHYIVICQEGWGKSGKSSANMVDVPADIHTKHLPNKHRSVTTSFNILGELIFLQALTFCGSMVVKALYYETRWGLYLALVFTQPLKQISTRSRKIMFLGSIVQPVHHLWGDCVDNVRSSTSHNPIGLHGLLRG
jgi:hypothetical protein